MDNDTLIRELPFWRGDLKIVPLEGGITNLNYLVSPLYTDPNERYVVRLGQDIPVHQILRFNEVAASKAAHAADLSPAIHYHGNGALIMDYVNAPALNSAQVREKNTLDRLVPLIQRCHNHIPMHLRGASTIFWVFHVARDYAASLKDQDSEHVDKLPRLMSAAADLEAAAGPHEIVFGHNDLLAANILDDGSRLWLIDWEYGGFNSPLFDLGGLASNNDLTELQEHGLLDAYYEKTVDDALWYRYQAMKTASLLRETLWSMISEVHSTLDFDYASYTRDNLVRFEKSLSEFRRL